MTFRQKSNSKSKMVDTTWYALLSAQCPMLKELVEDDTGQIQVERLHEIMESLDLQPCGDVKKSPEQCLQRNCAILWKYYVERKKHHSSPTPSSKEVARIADHLFALKGKFTYKPEDLGFLYDLIKVGDASYNIVRKKGEATLKIYPKVTKNLVAVNTLMQFLLVKHPNLAPYFVTLHQVETGTSAFQPTRKKIDTTHMYLLHESMDGNMVKFVEHFATLDPDYWHRISRLLIHALKGLDHLHRVGYGLNDVTLTNLMFRLDFKYNVTAAKWGSFDKVAPLSDDNHDLFRFGVMVYEILFHTEPFLSSSDYNDPKSVVHDNILKLRAPNDLQPLSTVAYHFLVNDQLFPDEKRWNYEQGIKYLGQHPLKKVALDSLPRVPDHW